MRAAEFKVFSFSAMANTPQPRVIVLSGLDSVPGSAHLSVHCSAITIPGLEYVAQRILTLSFSVTGVNRLMIRYWTLGACPYRFSWIWCRSSNACFAWDLCTFRRVDYQTHCWTTGATGPATYSGRLWSCVLLRYLTISRQILHGIDGISPDDSLDPTAAPPSIVWEQVD